MDLLTAARDEVAEDGWVPRRCLQVCWFDKNIIDADRGPDKASVTHSRTSHVEVFPKCRRKALFAVSRVPHTFLRVSALAATFLWNIHNLFCPKLCDVLEHQPCCLTISVPDGIKHPLDLLT